MFNALNFTQEKLKREKLQKELEIQSSEHDEKMQRTFATTLEIHQKSAEEAAALKAELTRTTHNNQQEIIALTEKVR